MNTTGFLNKAKAYQTHVSTASKINYNTRTPSYLKMKRKRDSFLTPALEEMHKVSLHVDSLLNKDNTSVASNFLAANQTIFRKNSRFDHAKTPAINRNSIEPKSRSSIRGDKDMRTFGSLPNTNYTEKTSHLSHTKHDNSDYK
jgi:hypothetical protein